MILNYLKIALRIILKHKVYTTINISGLAVSIACCMFILLYLQFEMSFDRYHDDLDRIYRIPLSSKGPAGGEVEPSNTPALVPLLREKYPQVERAARVLQWSSGIVKYGEQLHKERRIRHVDPEMLDILSMPFVHGNSSTALGRPATAVLTEEMVEKYFRGEDPLGKTIHINDRMYEVTGILKNHPPNTHFKYNILASLTTLSDSQYLESEHISCMTYVKLAPGVDAAVFEDLIRNVSQELIHSQSESKEVTYTNTLQPISDIHLLSHLSWEIDPPGSPMYLTIFSAIGVLILIIACINFMNLSTARSSKRSIEIGLRKVVGARRPQIAWQFLGESFIMSTVALMLALFIVFASLPFFNRLTSAAFTHTHLRTPPFLAGLFALYIFTGIIGGSYPAFFLSGFKPVSVLKGKLRLGSRGSLMRKILVVGQFTISIALIIATVIVYRQLVFMKSSPLGFDKEQKLVVPLQRGELVENNYELMKNELIQHHTITSATASTFVPGQETNTWWTWPTGKKLEQKQLVNFVGCDFDFFTDYGLEVISGRGFLKDIRSDTMWGAMILNEAAVRTFGWPSPEEALGQQIWDRRVPVIGVVRDFHWHGLQYKIEPAAFMVWPQNFQHFTLTVSTEDLEGTVSFVKKTFREWFPDYPLNYFFLDQAFDNQYRLEERIGRIFTSFSIIAILTACLGLFGLAAFIAEQRTKEIGIRKILGASVPRLVYLLNRQFLIWVLLANLFAWPIAWYGMNTWLQDFPYRIDLNMWLFIPAGVMALSIAFVTVSFQSLKASLTNPVESLRYE